MKGKATRDAKLPSGKVNTPLPKISGTSVEGRAFRQMFKLDFFGHVATFSAIPSRWKINYETSRKWIRTGRCAFLFSPN